jgi:hypothetical protein
MPRVQAEPQASEEKASSVAHGYGLGRTTVTKWRSRTTTDDAPMGPSVTHRAKIIGDPAEIKESPVANEGE